MLALSFTRDSTLVLFAAAGWSALAMRTRRSTVVLASGVAAALPALLLFGAPLKRQLAYVIQGFHPPTVVSWSYVIAHYPGTLASVLRQDAHYPQTLAYPVVWYAVGAVLVASVGYMFIAGPRRDPFFTLSRGALLGAAALLVLSINYTALRIELVFLPTIAAGLAFAVSRLVGPVRAWQSRNVNARAAVLEPDGP